MSKTATLTATLSISGDGVNESDVIIGPLVISPSPALRTIISLSPGANTVTIPTGAGAVSYCLLIPPSNSVNSKVLKGVTGDTGVQLITSSPMLLPALTFASPTTFVITSGGFETLTVYWL